MLNFAEIEDKINYTFKNKSLLETALTHTSYSNENGVESYERLEFLGDSILGFITAENLFSLHPDYSEGELTKLRASLVCEASLAKIFSSLKLSQYLRLGVGEIKNNGRDKETILCDSFESILAAVYIDSDYETAKKWLNSIMPPKKYDEFEQRDWKSILYENYPNAVIEYQVQDFGNERSERFAVKILIDGKVKAEGKGTTKKSAIQNASKNALYK